MSNFYHWIEDLLYKLKTRSHAILVTTFVALFSALLIQNPFKIIIPVYTEGEIARSDIKAPEPIVAIDDELTQSKKTLAAQTIMPVYDHDAQASTQTAKNLRDSFRYMRSQPKPWTNDHYQEFRKKLNADISLTDWQILVRNNFSRRIQSTIQTLLRLIQKEYVSPEEFSSPLHHDKVLVRDLQTGREREETYASISANSIPLKQIPKLFTAPSSSLGALWKRLSADEKAALTTIATNMIQVNLVFNQKETQARKEEVRSSVEPVKIEAAKGEIIVREGDRISREQSLLLRELSKRVHGRTNFLAFVSLSLLLFILMIVFNLIGRRNFKKFKLTKKDQLTVGGFFVGSLAFLVFLQFLYSAAQVQSLSGASLSLLLPFAFAGMTLRLFGSFEITTFFSILFGFCISWLLRDPYIGLTATVTALAGAARMRHIMQRADVFVAGGLAGLVQAVLVLFGALLNLTELPQLSDPWVNALAATGFCFGSGFLSSFLVLGVQPVIEKIGYTTDLRLMELSNTNHPLLRDMIIKAPGTYFHSFSVSQLAEKAAEAIHANALFARVSSLYHDIGKVKKPMYFIENIKGENKHDKLVPSMSALIISNHVKDGIELAQKHKLPQSIIEVIPQHHGTSLISYFHNKAKEQLKEGETLDEQEFKYPGPKPQTKEAAIIMLADAVEAAAKSLKEPTESAMREVVGKIINRFFLEGQLDECELSLKDLNAIGSAFLQVLRGVYHQRIDYPHMNKPRSEPQAKTKSAISRIAKTTQQEG